MSQNQFDALLAAIQTLKSDMNTGFTNVEGRLDNIEGELKRIEHATQYKANHDVVVELEGINGHRK
jgi:hypothetical protein